MKNKFLMYVGLSIFFVILIGCNAFGDNESDNSFYAARFQAADEDYVNFSTLSSFMNSDNWAILEKVKIPASATVGWHFFRGRAWEDKAGDVAIQIRSDVDTAQVNCLIFDSGLNYIQMHKNDVPGLEILDETWYTICLQHDAVNEKLELYVNGNFITELTSFAAIDDSGNTNKLFFGGQDVDPSFYLEGDLYSEADCVIAHQAWVQRLLTITEIEDYDGSFDENDSDLFFATEISASGISKAGGSGGSDGIIGNSPEFYKE